MIIFQFTQILWNLLLLLLLLLLLFVTLPTDLQLVRFEAFEMVHGPRMQTFGR
jgi:hypothetical protein